MTQLGSIQNSTNGVAPGPALKGGLLQGLPPFNVLLSDGAEVEEYLAIHAELTSLLTRICAKLREAFGNHVELSLEFYKDPEQPDRYPVLYIRQHQYEDGILSRIESVINAFMPQLEDASGNLLVTTDFRRPRG